MKIAGIDVSKDSVTICILENLPDIELKRFCKSYKPIVIKLSSITEINSLEFDAAILEPTGGHYSRLWAELIRRSGRTVRWVGHQEIAAYRKSYKLPDKTDKTDAVAIACYGLERWNEPGYFVTEKGEIALKLRELWLEHKFLNTANIAILNRLQQQLAHECPELANKKGCRVWLGETPGLWLAIANERRSKKWANTIENSAGLGISRFSENLAKAICLSEQSQQAIEIEIEQVIQASPELQRYLEVMKPFKFGRGTSTALLSHIYPIEKFQSRHNPLGAFKLSCGMAQVWHESGKYTGWVPGGSADLRSALWIWALATIPQKRNTNPELEILRDYYYNGATIEEAGEVKTLDPGKGNQRLMRVVRRAITMLYRKLRDIDKT
jgi:Transposase